MAAAILDRLLHRAAAAGIDGSSYWLRGRQNQAEALRAGVNARERSPDAETCHTGTASWDGRTSGPLDSRPLRVEDSRQLGLRWGTST
ncbi:hypothetical protein [Streptomyces sp. NPDC001292]|uniref:hypothetical protein n=1 Tax=Streptomyces sp. NPDC001292 TaxID=3364558 RepID=UPI003677E63A